MSTPQPQMHASAACKFLKLHASEHCHCQSISRLVALIHKKKNHLQLMNDNDGVLPLQWPPYCKTGGTTINKRQKMSTIIMGHVHCQPAPVFLHAQIPCFPMNWCWINQLAGFTGSDNRFNKLFGHRQVNDPYKVQRPLKTWVATLDGCQPPDFCLIGLLQWCKFLASVLSFTDLATFGGAHGVVVIAVGNEHGDTSSNPGRYWLHFT